MLLITTYVTLKIVSWLKNFGHTKAEVYSEATVLKPKMVNMPFLLNKALLLHIWLQQKYGRNC